MAVPYTFGSATTSIPLSQLDSNFATTITLGNTAIQLGNTVTTLNNMTFANATVSSGNVTVLNATVTNDASISGLTVGKGANGVTGNSAFGVGVLASGSLSAGYNTAIGFNSLAANTSGSNNTGIGNSALNANTTGADNQAFGTTALFLNTTGSSNTAVGRDSLRSNTTASNNTAVGYQAGYSNTTSSFNTFLGYQAGNTFNYTGGNGFNCFIGSRAGTAVTTGQLNCFVGDASGLAATTGSGNTFIGQSSGNSITTGGKNTIIGGYTGNSNSIDIRTASNNCIVSDGDGNPQIHSNSSSWVGTQWGSIDVTQGAAGSGTANSFGITSGTATPIFGGGNSFSGMFIINEFSQTGACALVMTAGNGITIVSQTPSTTFVVTSSPTSGQIGVYMSGAVVVVKPGVPGTTNYRIIAFRTRGSQ